MKSKLRIGVILVLMAGMANGLMDDIQFHYSESVVSQWDEQFWNPEISWKNKYAIDDHGALIRPLKARFFGSTTFLVSITDGWHLLKFIFLLCLHLLIAILLINQRWTWKTVIKVIIAWLVIYIIQTIGFYFTYSLL